MTVGRSLHVRLDDASAAALEIVRAGELTDSEAVQLALREAAARRRLRSAVRDEVRVLAADERDREEMRVVRAQLAELAPSSRDLPGLGVVGDSQEDVERLIREAIAFHLDGLRAAGEPIPEPTAVSTALVEVPAA